MMENAMKDTRLIQIFLPKTAVPGPGIFEVSVDNVGDLFCTCPGFENKGSCKHTRIVNTRIKTNGGTYPLEISKRATAEEADAAQVSNEAFREFIIKFGKIEVY